MSLRVCLAFCLSLLVQQSVSAQQVSQALSRPAYALPGGAPERKGVVGIKCRTCSGYEMSGLDASRMLVEPKTASVKKYAPPKKVVKKKVVRKPVHVVHHTAPAPMHHVVHQTPRLRATVAVHRPPPPKDKCKEVLNHMQELLAQQKDDAAEFYLKSMLAEYPEDLCIRRTLVKMLLCEAYGYLKCGEIECAARRLREVLFIDPRNAKATEMLDKAYEASGIDPSDSRTLLKVANKLLNQGRDVGAFVEFERLLDQGQNVDTYLGYARAAQRLGQTNIAMQAYQAVVGLDQVNGDAWRELGMLQQRSGDLTGAAASLGKAINVNPNDVLAGDSLVNLQQQQVASSPNNPVAHLQLANTLLMTGLFNQANAEYAQIAQMTNYAPQWQTTIADAQAQTSQLRQQALAALPAIASRNDQKAVQDFENVGPSPLRPHGQGVQLSQSCRCD